MKKQIRKLIPNEIVNLVKHLPSSVLANIIYGFPSRGMKFIGITGTDGKTTTTNMIYQILKQSGFKASMVSTINAEINGEKIDTGFHVTNPDYYLLQKLINKAKKAGTEVFVLEVTSHGLDQFRTWGINFDIGVITNITSEHLDYHKTWQNYFNSKSKLIKNAKWAVLNSDEDHFTKLRDLAKGLVVTFGKNKKANFNPEINKFKLKIPGEFNILNALAAIAATNILGVDQEKSAKILEDFVSLEGRMEVIENKLDLKIIVDFAHTANALENALTTLKKENKGKLISVFGCAGLRDVKKRPEMGEISARLADITILTAEDPRGQIDEINSQIMQGVKKGGGELGKNVYIENDRQKAIELAINLGRRGDTIGIFGKGHEKSNNIDGKTEMPWSDQEAVRKVLNERQI